MNWDASAADRVRIDRILERACALDERIDPISLHMDLVATHSNGCPLKLAELETATDADLMHDIYGIMRHLDRKTGTLAKGFTPRYAERQ